MAGKTVVLVGGGQTPGETIGNGRAAALLYARAGARVLVADRDPASAEETATLITNEGGTAEATAVDVADDDACAALVRTAIDHLGRIDVLHNNVGIGTGDAGATTVTEDAWQRIVDVNVTGMWRTCRHALPVLREQQAGAIINISSIAAVVGHAGLLAYTVSKAGVNALTHALATGNARFGIRVNAILPGLMDTPMAVDAVAATRGVSRDEIAEPRHRSVPLGRRMGSAWDVAAAALYLASDEARFVTGVLLPVDGGQSSRIG